MSRGLGPVQLRVLAMLAERPAGIYTTDLSALLTVEPRRGRAIVASLIERRLAVVARDPGDQNKLWLPDRRRRWLFEKAFLQYQIDSLSGRPAACPTCGRPSIRTASGRIYPLRPVESA